MPGIRLQGKPVLISLITKPCSERTCDHPLLAVRHDTGRVITVPASLVVAS